MPFDAEAHMTTDPRRAAALAAEASRPTLARALAAYDAALAGSNEFTLEDAAHLLAAAARRPKPAKAPKAEALGDRVAAALKVVSASMSRRNYVPVVGTALLTLENGRLRIQGTDLDQLAAVTVDGVPGADFSVCVDPWQLAQLLKGAESFSVEVEQWKQGNHVVALATLDVDGRRVQLKGYVASDFPKLATGDVVACAFMDSSALRDALAFVSPYISQEETRYYLNGACLQHGEEEGEDRLYFNATDGARLARQWMPAPAWDGTPPANILLPRAAVAWLLKHLPKAGDVMVEASASAVRFTLPEGEFTTKLIDGSFPDVTRVIPRPGYAEISVEIPDDSAFRKELSKVSAISQEKSRTVTITLAAGEVEASVRNLENGSVRASLPATSTGECELSFNAARLGDCVSAPCVMRLFGTNDPARFDYDGRPDRVAVLMPLRV